MVRIFSAFLLVSCVGITYESDIASSQDGGIICDWPRASLYTTRSTLIDKRGETSGCSSAKQFSVDTVRFDEYGSFEPPVPILSTCVTSHSVKECTTTIVCDSILFSAHGVFVGNLSSDGGKGVATLTGDYSGCKLLVYEVEAEKK